MYQGFAYDFVKALLIKSEIYNKIDMCETLLKLEGLNESEGKEWISVCKFSKNLTPGNIEQIIKLNS